MATDSYWIRTVQREKHVQLSGGTVYMIFWILVKTFFMIVRTYLFKNMSAPRFHTNGTSSFYKNHGIMWLPKIIGGFLFIEARKRDKWARCERYCHILCTCRSIWLQSYLWYKVNRLCFHNCLEKFGWHGRRTMQSHILLQIFIRDLEKGYYLVYRHELQRVI